MLMLFGIFCAVFLIKVSNDKLDKIIKWFKIRKLAKRAKCGVPKDE
jgi:hypothetical protein